jgi:hypothetical protein
VERLYYFPSEYLVLAIQASDGLGSVNLKRIKRFYHSQRDAFGRRTLPKGFLRKEEAHEEKLKVD